MGGEPVARRGGEPVARVINGRWHPGRRGC